MVPANCIVLRSSCLNTSLFFKCIGHGERELLVCYVQWSLHNPGFACILNLLVLHHVVDQLVLLLFKHLFLCLFLFPFFVFITTHLLHRGNSWPKRRSTLKPLPCFPEVFFHELPSQMSFTLLIHFLRSQLWCHCCS